MMRAFQFFGHLSLSRREFRNVQSIDRDGGATGQGARVFKNARGGMTHSGLFASDAMKVAVVRGWVAGRFF
jgi:hypothetical protein